MTLRFLLVLWVPLALGIADNATPTLLNAMVAVGIVVGGRCRALRHAEDGKTLHAGRDPDRRRGRGVRAANHHAQCLCLVGDHRHAGGFFVVPLNALLQERGKHSVGAGNAIAVQNGENAAMLLMLALYSLVVKLGVPVVGVGVGFGVVFALAISVLWWSQRR